MFFGKSKSTFNHKSGTASAPESTVRFFVRSPPYHTHRSSKWIANKEAIGDDLLMPSTPTGIHSCPFLLPAPTALHAVRDCTIAAAWSAPFRSLFHHSVYLDEEETESVVIFPIKRTNGSRNRPSQSRKNNGSRKGNGICFDDRTEMSSDHHLLASYCNSRNF